MVNFMALWTMIRAVGPAFFLMASAFRYGAQKYGDGTWRNVPAGDHLEAAVKDIVGWKQGDVTSPLLVDAAMHVVFAVAVAMAAGKSPEEYTKQ
jgi:hypothetical protein